MSNLLYAQKYNRPFAATQVGLPFLHILLLCDEDELKSRLHKRGKELHQSEEYVNNEIAKISDQNRFIELADRMKDDYHIITIDTTGKTIEQVGLTAKEMIDDYVSKLENDEKVSEWNAQYRKGCDKLGLNFSVKDNQPYINNIAFMSESTLQNGVYETFSDKSYPDNFIFALGYDSELLYDSANIEKKYDFAYIINSKIKRRPEIYNYLIAFIGNKKTCMVADNPLIPALDSFYRCPRTFGDDYIKMISQANATVYCARDLATLKLQTARLYEAILANQILFVDEQSDPDREILKQIYGDDTYMIEILTVTPQTICRKYDRIISSLKLKSDILIAQRQFFDRMKETCTGGLFNETK